MKTGKSYLLSYRAVAMNEISFVGNFVSETFTETTLIIQPRIVGIGKLSYLKVMYTEKNVLKIK